MSLQKLKVREVPKLRESARHAPHCFGCERPNTGGNLVLAHDNRLESGRGAYFKTPDYLGAILCADADGCHDKVDGRSGGLTKDEKHELHAAAHRKTLTWWFETGVLK
jgi:hypothetical protein